jgi:UDP-glucose 4-epimerase
MIDRINALTGHDHPPTVTPRRPGDPARVVASADRAAVELGWKAKYDVEDMITSAWAGWVRLHPGAARD